MVITFPFENIGDDQDDATYLPSAELAQLKTRHQAEEALKSSHKITERVWTIWSREYLTSLREFHKLNISNRRGNSKNPEKGAIVLISDEVLPRNSWKIGRILALKDKNGIVREAELKMPNGRQIRRPINQLIPLESEDRREEVATRIIPKERRAEQRYNLRPRQRNESRGTVTTATMILSCAFFLISGVLSTTELTTRKSLINGQLRCIPGGVEINTRTVQRYELCAESYCVIKEAPPNKETITFPPEVVLHEHRVQWKVFDGQRFSLLEANCPSVSFCGHVNCFFCTANIFKPECSLWTALLAMAFSLYIGTALLYVLCHVPVVVGKPCRLIACSTWMLILMFGRLGRKLILGTRRRRRPQRDDVEALLRAPLLTVNIGMKAVAVALACQDVDVFSHQGTRCFFSPTGTKMCSMETTEILKLNSLQQEACVRFMYRNRSVKELRVSWKGVRLICHKETTTFTRSATEHVVDAKRCAHAGSCTRNKCEDITPTSLIPELEQGNKYPGITRCVESCGGPGCGCFYLSSGCLFYRIYNVPSDEKIYEIFSCHQWSEEVHLEITTITEGRAARGTLILQPAVSQRINGVTMTLSSLTVPKTPSLTSSFIFDGSSIALWSTTRQTTLNCDFVEAATALNCSVATSCNCQPAENKINCVCSDINISHIFEYEIENRLPIRRPGLTLLQSQRDSSTVEAVIPSMTTAELIFHAKDKFNIIQTSVTDSVCRVNNAIANGCYHCVQGASAKITCDTNGQSTIATIKCDNLHLAVPCQTGGKETSLRFPHGKARVRKVCEVTCGSVASTIEITGILQFTRTIHGSAAKILKGESNIFDETVLPDFEHIFDVLLSWYKTAAVVALMFLLAIVAGYFFLWSLGFKLARGLLLYSYLSAKHRFDCCGCSQRELGPRGSE